MGKIEQIQQAIEDANNLQSKINQEALLIGGYTSDKIRHLLNNLAGISTHYLEIGSHRGATLISALSNHLFMPSAAIDNFSELDDDKTVENELLNNIDKFLPYQKPVIYKQDCFSVIDNLLPQIEDKKFDLYLYDGNHSYESQKKALTYFIDCMADEFIFCVDDYNWHDVSTGTQDAIKELGLTVLFERALVTTEWWNGFAIFLLKK